MTSPTRRVVLARTRRITLTYGADEATAAERARAADWPATLPAPAPQDAAEAVAALYPEQERRAASLSPRQAARAWAEAATLNHLTPNATALLAATLTDPRTRDAVAALACDIDATRPVVGVAAEQVATGSIAPTQTAQTYRALLAHVVAHTGALPFAHASALATLAWLAWWTKDEAIGAAATARALAIDPGLPLARAMHRALTGWLYPAWTNTAA